MSGMKLQVARGFKFGTRIQSIEVPPELRVKHSSGIDWLDVALGNEGGFTPTCTVMLTGGPGAGKSTLLRQLAGTLDENPNNVVVYNTGEESLFQARMALERLQIHENFRVGEERMLPKILTELDNMKKANPKKQIFFLQDSLQTLDDGKYVDAKGNSRGTTSSTPMHCVEMIVDWMQRNFGISIFIGQCNKAGDFAGKNGIKHAIDAHAHMYVDEKEKSDTYGCLLLEVQKNRWGCNGMTMVLGMEQTGIVERGNFTKPGFAGALKPADDA